MTTEELFMRIVELYQEAADSILGITELLDEDRTMSVHSPMTTLQVKVGAAVEEELQLLCRRNGTTYSTLFRDLYLNTRGSSDKKD